MTCASKIFAHEYNAGQVNIEAGDITEISLEQLLNTEVFTASKFNQKTSEAPSRVTVITSDAIRQFGYRTVKDILNSIPGLYTTYDRNYSYLGVRGFGLPGDYSTRILMLLDGQRVNDNIYDSFGIDYDSIINVDLIERVEFSAGPGSAIYGANAVFGVINVITKSGDAIDGVQVSADYASENSRRARVSAGSSFDSGIDALFSASAYKSDGADLYFPEFDDPATNNGVAVGRDYHESQNLFLKLKYESWGFEAAYNNRTKGIPTASYEQEFNMPPSETTDTLGMATLTYDSAIDSRSQVFGSISLGRFEYIGDYIYDYPPLTVNRDESLGEWWNAELRYQSTHFDNHRIILGTELQNNGTQQQANYDVDPFASYLDDMRSGERYGLYLQDEIKLSQQLILNAGIRYDRNIYGTNTSNIKKSIASPRLALIYAMQPETTLKFIYGTSYRNPNAYELFYPETLGYLPNTELEPEEVETFEIGIEHYLNNNFRLAASFYSNKTTNLIGLFEDPGTGDLFFNNLDDVTAQGTDLEAEYIDDNGLQLRSSYSFVDTEDKSTGVRLTNSPEHMFKFNMSAPVFRQNADAGIEFQYMSSRTTPNGGSTGGYSITNLTLSSQKIYERLELSASIYNLFDKQYADPVSVEHVQSSIVQDGRNFRIKASYTF
ncbi:MAG: TonB-dependent receptor [Gammaproteobacteria bacterium]|nr:TonB-dependent receptor [Gammaproteobacteria bacterium]NNJ50307.1 TonB-dependent receptor [Gammaproteobacteria bacterium]